MSAVDDNHGDPDQERGDIDAFDDEDKQAAAAFRKRIAEVILRHARLDGASDAAIYNQITELTGRSYSAVKSWLRYKISLPDLRSMAQIVEHWKIPLTEVFAPGQVNAGSTDKNSLARWGSAAGPVLFDLSPLGTTEERERGFAKYSAATDSLVLMQHDSIDTAGMLEAGDLMLVDTSVESIQQSGVYVLRVGREDTGERIYTRQVQLLLGKPCARVSTPGAANAQGEDLPIRNGLFEYDDITVLGRVRGTLRAV
jgi:hypothetical protein